MKAIVVRALGGPEVLVVEEVPAPVPAPGELLVEIRAIGVNFADTERRRGVYATPKLPWIPGREAAGVVVAVGSEVDPAWIGRSVAYWSPRASSSYAERATVPVEHAFTFSREVPFATMAALPLQGLTAHGVVHLAAQVRADDVVLVHAAAGGVGQIAVQLARRAGARVLGTASSEAKLAALRSLGAESLPYGDELLSRVRALTDGRGVDVVLDSVGRDTQAVSLAALAPFGRLIFFGEASGAPMPIDVDSLYERSVRVGAFGLNLDVAPERWAAARRDLAAAVTDGSLTLTVSRSWPLADAAEAHRALEGRGTMGKLVLIP